MTILTDPLIFDIHAETSIEDGGSAVILELHGTEEEVYVQITSWDPSAGHAHRAIAPFRSDPESLRVTLERVLPPITEPPENLDNATLEVAREQVCLAISELHLALARARHPRRCTPEAVTDLTQIDIADGEARLAAIDAEIEKRSIS